MESLKTEIPDQDQHWADLYQQLKDGDRDAWEKLFAEVTGLAAPLYRNLTCYLPQWDDDEVDGLADEFALHLFENDSARLHKFDPDRNPRGTLGLRGFVRKLARWFCLEHLRRQPVLEQVEDFDLLCQETAAEPVTDWTPLDEDGVLDFIARIPGPEGEALRLRADGYRYAEAAEKLGVSEAAFKGRLQRGRAKLAGLLGGELKKNAPE